MLTGRPACQTTKFGHTLRDLARLLPVQRNQYQPTLWPRVLRSGHSLPPRHCADRANSFLRSVGGQARVVPAGRRSSPEGPWRRGRASLCCGALRGLLALARSSQARPGPVPKGQAAEIARQGRRSSASRTGKHPALIRSQQPSGGPAGLETGAWLPSGLIPPPYRQDHPQAIPAWPGLPRRSRSPAGRWRKLRRCAAHRNHRAGSRRRP